MTALLPRLDREQTLQQIDEARTLSIEEIARRMPVRDVKTTSSALGGLELSAEHLTGLRLKIVELAREHGYPKAGKALPEFDALCARVVHERLPIAPHEASEEDAWSNLTCCWLLDVAAWRWGGIGDSDRRFRGDVNRNTFRRLWWRAEILGVEIDLTHLGEDELVNIMERPTIASNRRLARSLAKAFLARVGDGDEGGRMMLMREAAKRLVRLTPLVDFHALNDAELHAMVDGILAAAAEGGSLPTAQIATDPVQVSEGVQQVPRAPVLDSTRDDDENAAEAAGADLDDLFEVALGIARRTGRVTNTALREVVPLEAADARRLLQTLVDRGALSRHGKAKGTYYVLSAEQPDRTLEQPTEPSAPPTEPSAPVPPPSVPPPAPSPVPSSGNVETTLRRFLRRGRP